MFCLYYVCTKSRPGGTEVRREKGWMLVSHHVSAGNWTRSPGRAASALMHWAISPASGVAVLLTFKDQLSDSPLLPVSRLIINLQVKNTYRKKKIYCKGNCSISASFLLTDGIHHSCPGSCFRAENKQLAAAAVTNLSWLLETSLSGTAAEQRSLLLCSLVLSSLDFLEAMFLSIKQLLSLNHLLYESSRAKILSMFLLPITGLSALCKG